MTTEQGIELLKHLHHCSQNGSIWTLSPKDAGWLMNEMVHWLEETVYAYSGNNFKDLNWVCPRLAGVRAAGILVGLGLWEKREDSDWYRPVAQNKENE